MGYSPWGCKESDTTEHTCAQRRGRGHPLKAIILSTYHAARNTSPLNTAPGERRPRQRDRERGDGGGERWADTHSHPASSGGGSFLAGWSVHITLEKLVMFLH